MIAVYGDYDGSIVYKKYILNISLIFFYRTNYERRYSETRKSYNVVKQ